MSQENTSLECNQLLVLHANTVAAATKTNSTSTTTVAAVALASATVDTNDDVLDDAVDVGFIAG